MPQPTIQAEAQSQPQPETELRTQLVSFEEFLETCPEDGHYELHRGVLVELQPTGAHEKISSFLNLELGIESRRLQLSYLVGRNVVVRSLDADSGYKPDLLVLDESALTDEPLWEKCSTVLRGQSVQLAIEIASSNWRDDYLKKLKDYEELQIPEYWIVDHLGLAATRYIGNPKQPTLSIYTLDGNEYQVSQFRGDERLISPAFPELELTAAQVFQARR